jgi:hypothetical protein
VTLISSPSDSPSASVSGSSGSVPLAISWSRQAVIVRVRIVPDPSGRAPRRHQQLIVIAVVVGGSVGFVG